jgi:hypothetical protein
MTDDVPTDAPGEDNPDVDSTPETIGPEQL